MEDGFEIGADQDLLEVSPEEEACAAFRLNHGVFKEIYQPYSQDFVRNLSKRQRNSLLLHSSCLSYSEMDFESFGELLIRTLYNSGVEMKRFKKFVDIGSGCGKLVFAAYFTNIFAHCTGIEILSSLHDLSCAVRNDYGRKYLEADETVNIEFINGDATVVEWGDANVAFAYATGFTNATMYRISVKARAMRHGSLLIVVTQRYKQTSTVYLLSVNHPLLSVIRN
jgi:hypothetical protein